MPNLKLFKIKDYRRLIEHAFDIQKAIKGATYAQAAKYAGMQATYFSNVLKGRADFSEDQIFAISEYLQLNELEALYLRTLHQFQRSQLKSRRQSLTRQLDSIRIQSESHAKRLEIEPVQQSLHENEMLFFLEPRHQLLLFALGLEPKTDQLLSVGRALGLSDANTRALLDNLISIKKLRVENKEFVRDSVALHIGPDSKLLGLHQSAVRTLSLERMRQLSRDDFKALSVTFSASKKDFPAIRDALSRCLDEVRDLVKNSLYDDDNVCQLNLDFFSWFQKT